LPNFLFVLLDAGGRVTVLDYGGFVEGRQGLLELGLGGVSGQVGTDFGYLLRKGGLGSY